MSELAQRIEPIRSDKYLAGSKGETCKLRFSVCQNERDTVVPCHVPDGQRGGARKSDDLSVVDGCWRCHQALDLHTHGLSDGDLYRTLLRAVQETLRARWERGLLVIPLTASKPLHERKTKPRKPKGERKKIQSRNEWPQGRTIQNRKPERTA